MAFRTANTAPLALNDNDIPESVHGLCELLEDNATGLIDWIRSKKQSEMEQREPSSAQRKRSHQNAEEEDGLEFVSARPVKQMKRTSEIIDLS